MYAPPSLTEVMQAARRIGVELDEAQAGAYRTLASDLLREFHEFLETPMPELGAPPPGGPRAPGHRPSRAEDPFCAWLWKCHITGASDGKLSGKTVSFKDNVAVAGLPLTFGSLLFDGLIADFDATMVTRSLAAGATVIGKNALVGFTSDFAMPKNPHNAEHSPGGSSSGSAVAVAAGEVDVSFGGDQGGSVRTPAAYCGVLGLKPTFGLISHMGASYLCDPSLDHAGPLARTTSDLALALEAVAGYDELDPRQRKEIPDTVEVMSTLDHGVEGLRIAVLEEGFDSSDAGVHDTVLAALDVLQSQGAILEKVSVPEHARINTVVNALGTTGSRTLFETTLFGTGAETFYPTSLIVAFQRAWSTSAKNFNPTILLGKIVGDLARTNYHGAAYAKAQNVRAGFRAAYDNVLARCDLIALPTTRTTAPRIEEPPPDPIEALQWTLDRVRYGKTSNTQQFDYTGHPALAVPVGMDRGLPVSLQLVGRHLDEATLLRAARCLEQVLDPNPTPQERHG